MEADGDDDLEARGKKAGASDCRRRRYNVEASSMSFWSGCRRLEAMACLETGGQVTDVLEDDLGG
jgi:hypothetical protein